MKRILCAALCVLAIAVPAGASAAEIGSVYPYDAVADEFWGINVPAVAEYVPDGDAKALLLMEFSTGRVLFAENETAHLPIASVTKVISTLLIAEALDSGKITLEDEVTVSERAASMGGSQVFLEPGERMSVRDLLKALVVVSANDATVALGEYVYGSEDSFIAAMNARAAELGCENSNFVNTNGLPAEGHYSCALDVAVVTRELMKHEFIFGFTGIWMDTIRNGAFGLANTNKLIRFYKGATGMKTGFTSEAGYCLSGTATRDGMSLIAVVLGGSTSKLRFAAAKGLLDYGFANYRVFSPEPPVIEPAAVTHGTLPQATLETPRVALLCEKSAAADNVQAKVEVAESIAAPVEPGTEVGVVRYYIGGTEVASAPVLTAASVPRVTYFSLLLSVLRSAFAFL